MLITLQKNKATIEPDEIRGYFNYNILILNGKSDDKIFPDDPDDSFVCFKLPISCFIERFGTFR